MTVKDAIISELGFAPGNLNVVEKAIIDNDLTGTDIYSKTTHSTGVKKATLQVCKILYSTADTTTSNAGVVTNSIKYDRQYLKERIKDLETDLGIYVAPVSTARAIRRW